MFTCPEPQCFYRGQTQDELDAHKSLMDRHNLHEAQASGNPIPFCIGCYKRPEEIHEYLPEATGTKLDPDAFVKREEGTYNKANGHFLCTECYIKVGQPSSPTGWKAP